MRTTDIFYETINLRFSDQVSISSASYTDFILLGAYFRLYCDVGDVRGVEVHWTPEMRIVYLYLAI